MQPYEYICREERLITTASRQVYLNKLGAAGWELVNIEAGGNNGMFGSRVFTFKRKCPPVPKPVKQPGTEPPVAASAGEKTL